MQHFYSHGKLLLTGEYVVLDTAIALALPTRFGQKLTVETIDKPKITWQSLDEKNTLWFEDEFKTIDRQISKLRPHETHTKQARDNNNKISKRLIEILQAAANLNPEFLSYNKGYKITSKLEFPNNWGLGSSSTLLNNVAQWAKIDAFALSNATFGGSGYDIACAQNNSAIIYQRINNDQKISPITFKKPFEDKLFFIHLNQKQNSRDAIKNYQAHKKNSTAIISRINTITQAILDCNTLSTFEKLITEHELLIGDITSQAPVKQRLFNDYKHATKSLGAWGGDFILATGDESDVFSYFSGKGYDTIIPFKEMILK